MPKPHAGTLAVERGGGDSCGYTKRNAIPCQRDAYAIIVGKMVPFDQLMNHLELIQLLVNIRRIGIVADETHYSRDDNGHWTIRHFWRSNNRWGNGYTAHRAVGFPDDPGINTILVIHVIAAQAALLAGSSNGFETDCAVHFC